MLQISASQFQVPAAIIAQEYIMSAPNDDYPPGPDGVETSHTADTIQNDYESRSGQSHIPVVADDSNIEDPIDGGIADSDEQLGMLFIS